MLPTVLPCFSEWLFTIANAAEQHLQNNGIDEAFLYAPGTPLLIVDVDSSVLFEFEAGQLPDGRTDPVALVATAQ